MNITPTQLNFLSTSDKKNNNGQKYSYFLFKAVCGKKKFKQPGFTPGPLGVNRVKIPSENSSGQ